MTVIVGLVAEDGTIYMGGDSAATNNVGDQMLIENQKVFYPVKCPWYLIGFAGSFRLGQLLRYSLPRIPKPPKNADVQHFLSTVFVDGMRKCFKAAGFSKFSQHGQERGGFCLVGYKGQIYRIEDDYQVLVLASDYAALGTGQSFALGSLHSTEQVPSLTPEERILMALKAAVANNSMCRDPLYIRTLPPLNAKAR